MTSQPYRISDPQRSCMYLKSYEADIVVVGRFERTIWRRQLHWDDRLTISQLQQKEIDSKGHEAQSLAFPIGFTRGFGLKRKCMKWLEEWENLPYTSPYADASHLESRADVSEKRIVGSRADVSEKRIVGVFHELLNLTIRKKTDQKNVSNLCRPLDLPQKFIKVFARHPGIFYISQKCATQTVILKDSYDRRELISKHPLVEIREKYFNMMKTGMLNRKRCLYRTEISGAYKEDQNFKESW
ncbi:hypothetical protein GIB67_038415 [Kingdonia uniflora]|uniref:PORR domain-containing protein n=1 Tax=Kingdonia uniflora TaxID=39325 RepID=A0A7J7NPR2_9MAGN|nr:hypothetical protein GIB67_038415 [Kingdonia uniflora]